MSIGCGLESDSFPSSVGCVTAAAAVASAAAGMDGSMGKRMQLLVRPVGVLPSYGARTGPPMAEISPPLQTRPVRADLSQLFDRFQKHLAP